ncbi:MAG: hypothetical protein ACE5JM_15135, partial [Armatimonadota bacterium]
VPTTPGAYSSSDMVRVTMYFERFRLALNPQHLLDLFDWTDVDSSGTYEDPDERNLMFRDWIAWTHPAFGVANGPNGFGYIHDPVNRTHDGLAIKLRNVTDTVAPLPMTLQVDFYERMDFPWLTESSATETILANSTVTVALTATVPADADPGLYESVVLFHLDDGNVTTLPVVVNVAMAPPLPASFGGNTYDYGPHQQGVQYGSKWDLFDPTASGDFRYYFLDVPTDKAVTVLLSWESEASSGELYVLTNETDWFTDTLPSRYGPGTQMEVAMSSSNSNGTSVRAEMKAGLNIIVSRSTFLAGVAVEEHPVGQVGIIDVDPYPWTDAGIPVDGGQTFTITSDFDFPDVTAFPETGLSMFVEGVDIGQDERHDYFMTFERAQVLRVTLDGNENDVDLFVFWCDPSAGAFVEMGSSTTPTADEFVEIQDPPDGEWKFQVHGWFAPAGTMYDLFVSVVQEPFLTVTSQPDSITAGVPVELEVEYSLPHAPESFGGILIVGSTQFPRAIVIPLSLTPDLPPTFANFTPADGASTNDASPTISVDMADFPDAFETAVDPASVELWLGGLNLTGFASITPTSASVTLPFNITDGVHNITVTAADTAGSRNETAWSFTVDTQAPSLTITSPT